VAGEKRDARHRGLSFASGPAARGDHATIAAPREALVQAGLSELLSLYDPLTERAIAMSRRDG